MFSQVYVKNSVHGGGGRCTPHWTGRPPLARHHHPSPGRQHHPPMGQADPHGQKPLSQRQTATAADGTHPTGMHSCFIIILHDTNTLMMSLQILTLSELKNQKQPIGKSVLTQLERPIAMKNKVKDKLLKNHTSVSD